MKKISLFVACGLSLSGLLLPTHIAFAHNDISANIHIDRSRQFPETRWADANHYIQVHVPVYSEALADLRLQVTKNLKFEVSQVEVFNLQGQKIPVTVTEIASSQPDFPERIVQLVFATPVASGTQLDIRIRNVRKTLISQPSTYSLSAKSVDSHQSQFVGAAYFRSY
jgi:hypothetical protein